MRFAIAAALVAGVSANYNATAPAVAYTTEIVSAYVTYCPGPTTIAHGNVTYTVTEVRERREIRRVCLGGGERAFLAHTAHPNKNTCPVANSPLESSCH
jgi:hypothetical protein